MQKSKDIVKIPGYITKAQRTVGRYAIGMEIGSGNYGKVYLGYHETTKQVVAIKEIPRKFKEVSVEIKKEARLLLQLHHQNIVKMFGYYDDEQSYYLILEYCRYGDLYEFLKNFPNHTVPEFQARVLAQQIFQGMKHMYEHNIVHRDLKLENILISEDYTPKIADFGLGRSAESSEDILKTFCGTPIGMAPEIKVGSTYDAKCDIWSLGVMLYEILFGRLPFGAAKSRGDVLKAIDRVDWPPFPKLVNVTDSAKNLLRKMLIANPKDRIDFDELFKHKWITGESEIPTPITMIQKSEEQKMLGRSDSDAGHIYWYDKEKGIDQKARTSCKLFEEFLIVGVDQQDTQAFEKSNPEYEVISDDRNPKSIIKDYCFPFGLEIVKERIISITDLYERASIQNVQEIPENFFVFQILPDQSVPQKQDTDEIIKRLNPDRVLYVVCLKRPDYVELGKPIDPKKTGRVERKHWKTKKVYCFLTYYPCFRLFFDLLVQISEQLRSDIIKIVQSLESVSYEETMNDFKREFILPGIVRPYLAKVHETSFPNFNSQIELTEERFEKITYHLKAAEEAIHCEGEWAGPIVFSYFPLNDLLHLLSLVLLEKRIVLFSSNLALLTSTMTALHAFLKPLSYHFPIIFMQANQFDFLDAPTPLIAGINQGLDFVIKNEFPSTHNGSVVIVLENERIIIFGDTFDVPEFDFADFRNSALADYKLLNQNSDNSDSMIYYVSSTEQAAFLVKNYLLFRRGFNEPQLCYFADPRKMEACQRILINLYNCVENYVCGLLPEEPKRFDLSNELDNNMIERYARENSKTPSAFLDEFVLGQQFRNYSIKFYQNLTFNPQLAKVMSEKRVKATEAESLKAQLQVSRTQMKRVKTMLSLSQQMQTQAHEKERMSMIENDARKTTTKKSFLFF